MTGSEGTSDLSRTQYHLVNILHPLVACQSGPLDKLTHDLAAHLTAVAELIHEACVLVLVPWSILQGGNGPYLRLPLS